MKRNLSNIKEKLKIDINLKGKINTYVKNVEKHLHFEETCYLTWHA